MRPITSVRVKLQGAHAEVSVWVNHALAGTLCMRPEEAREFEAGLERAERVEAAALETLAELEQGEVNSAEKVLRAPLADAPEGSGEWKA